MYPEKEKVCQEIQSKQNQRKHGVNEEMAQ